MTQTMIINLIRSIDRASNALIADLARNAATALNDIFTPNPSIDPDLPYFSDSIHDDLTFADDMMRLCTDTYLSDDDDASAIMIHALINCLPHPDLPFDCLHQTLLDFDFALLPLLTYRDDCDDDDHRPPCPND